MRVIRLQTDEGTGPFGVLMFDFTEVMGNSYYNSLPTPSEDQIPWVNNLVCGIPETETRLFDEWFPPQTHALLSKAGIKLTIWEVPPTAMYKGQKQVCFNREQSILMEVRPIQG